MHKLHFLCSYFFQVIQFSKDEDIVAILTQLRATYDPLLRQKTSKKYACVCKKKTLAGTLDEVNNE